MNRFIVGLPGWLAATVFAMACVPAQAMPKAAEHENAPVTYTAEAAKPRAISSTTKANTSKAAKAKAPAKTPTRHPARSTQRK